MKTKYSQLLKIKKQKIETIENTITILNLEIKKNEFEIEKIINDIKSLKSPKSGKFSIIMAYNYSFETLIHSKKEKQLLLIQKKEKLSKLQKDYKTALIEFEKVKYLEDLIIKEKIEKDKKEEQKMIDEISVMNFSRRKI